MVISRKTRARDYKERKPITAFGRLVLPLTLIMAVALLYFSVKLFFFAPEKFTAEHPSQNVAAEVFLTLPADKEPPIDDGLMDGEPYEEATLLPDKQKKPPKRVVAPTVAAVKKPTQPAAVKPKSEESPKGSAKPQLLTKAAVRAEGGARWDVQIGGFFVREGAELTLRQAKESGYTVYIVDSVFNGKPFYKVRVKGEKDKKSSAELSERLAKIGFPVYLVEIKR